MKELKKKLMDSESSSKVLSQQIHQLEDEASDRYAVDYLWARLDSLHTFHVADLCLPRLR